MALGGWRRVGGRGLRFAKIFIPLSVVGVYVATLISVATSPESKPEDVLAISLVNVGVVLLIWRFVNVGVYVRNDEIKIADLFRTRVLGRSRIAFLRLESRRLLVPFLAAHLDDGSTVSLDALKPRQRAELRSKDLTEAMTYLNSWLANGSIDRSVS